MPTLHWVGKDKVFNHHHEVPFRVLNKVSTFAAPEGTPANTTDNRIIHGDNLEALKSLLPEFEGRVKCIYIDPPYNTGNEGWVYNDAVNDPKMKRWLGQVVGKEGEDLSRHDKWLCMMYPRLKLLHRLLSDDGVIFISIDDNEVHNLRAILNEIFGPGNFVVNMIWQKMDSPSSNFGERAFSNYHDHTLVFAKRLSACKLKQLPKPEILKDYPEIAEDGRRCRTRQLRKNGKAARREDRETMWFAMEAPDGSEIWPRHPEEGWDGRWAIGKKAYKKLKDADKVVWKMRDHGWVPYLLALSHESQVMNLVSRLTELVGNMYPITDPEVKEYIRRVVTGMNAEQIRDCIERDVAYVRKIKQKITTLANAHAMKAFTDMLDVDRIAMQPSFALPESITPSANASAVPKRLYVTEAAMGDFERRLINDVANLDSVQWWHRNGSRGKGFRVNGFLNHYPDFIVKTKTGRIIVLETKGDDRDNTDSELKLKLGKLWEAKAGRDYRYMMVFENNPIDGAERLADALAKIRQL